MLGDIGSQIGANFYKEIAKEQGIIKGQRNEPESPLQNTVDYKNVFFEEEGQSWKERSVYMNFKDSKGGNPENDVFATVNSLGNIFQSSSESSEIDDFLEKGMDLLRKKAEKMDKVDGIQAFAAAYEGAGSCLLDRFMSITQEYKEKPKLFHILYNINSTKDVEIANQICSFQSIMENSDFVNVADVSSLNNAAKNTNSIEYFGKAIADISLGWRSNGRESYSFSKLVFSSPYPRIKFNTASYSAIGNLNSLNDPNCCLGKINYDKKYKYLNSTTIYRGDCSIYNVKQELAELSMKYKAGWGSASFTPYFVNLTGVDGKPSCVRLNNHSSISELADTLLAKNISNSCCDGFDSGFFSQASGDLRAFAMDYNEVTVENEDY